MKNPFIAISLFISLFFLVSFAPSTKVKYSSKEGKFSINFPADYKSEDMSNESYKSIQTSATIDEQLFFVTYNIHTTTLTDHEKLAETSLKSFVEAMDGTITSQDEWKVSKQNGVKAKIKVEKIDLAGEYGAVIVGQIQYQVAVVSTNAKWNQARTDAFFKSFKLSK